MHPGMVREQHKEPPDPTASSASAAKHSAADPQLPPGRWAFRHIGWKSHEMTGNQPPLVYLTGQPPLPPGTSPMVLFPGSY